MSKVHLVSAEIQDGVTTTSATVKSDGINNALVVMLNSASPPAALVGNAPATPGQALAVTAVQVSTSVEVTVADLVPGTRYRMRLTPLVITDVAAGIWQCSAAGPINDATDGFPILQYEDVIIVLPAGSTKVRVFFWSLVAVNCTMWLAEIDA